MDHLWITLFCTVHLCLGYLLGRRIHSGAYQPTMSAAGIMPAVGHFERAYVAVESELSLLPNQLQAAMAQMKQAVQVLSAEVAKQPRSESPAKVAGCTSDIAPAANDPEHHESRRAIRRGYAVPELMAPYEDDLSTIRTFEPVTCHDLSTSGISFFLERPLDRGDKLVITLGQREGGVIMAAKVVYARPVIVRGEDRYRVGCEFERRLNADEVELLRASIADSPSASGVPVLQRS